MAVCSICGNKLGFNSRIYPLRDIGIQGCEKCFDKWDKLKPDIDSMLNSKTNDEIMSFMAENMLPIGENHKDEFIAFLETKRNAILKAEKQLEMQKRQSEMQQRIKTNIKGFMITTGYNFEGYKIDKYLGPVTGADSYLAGGLIGEGLLKVDSLYENSFSRAKSIIMSKAASLDANAIIGLKATLTSITNGYIVVTLIGTAVKIVPKEE